MDSPSTNPEPVEEPRRWWRLLIPFLTGLVSLALFWPVLENLSDQFLGIEEVDAYGTQWFYWVVHELWSDPGSVQLTDLQESSVIFHPYGKDIYSHTGSNLLDAFMAIPFRALLGPVAGYNVFCLLGMVFNGWAFSRLAREFSSNQISIWLSSLWFACSPFVLYEFVEGRPTQGIVGLLPLFLLHLWRTGLGPGWRSPVLAGVFLALVGFQYWFYAFFGGLAALAHGFWRTARPISEEPGGKVFLRHSLIAAVAILICTPVAWPLFQASADGTTPGLLVVNDWSLSHVNPITQEGTEIGMLGFQPWLGQSAFMVLTSGDVNVLGHQENLSFVALVLFGIWVCRPGALHRGPVLVICGLLGLVSIGPVIMLGEGWIGNPLYIALVNSIGFLRRLWWPGRAFVIPCIFIGLFGTVALDWARGHGLRFQWCAALVLSGLWFWDLKDSSLLPLSTWSAEVPAGYECLAEGDEGAVIVLPFGWNQAHLYYQTVHERPMVGGMLESNVVFSPTEAVNLRRENSWLRAVLAQAEWGEAFPEARTRAEERLLQLEEKAELEGLSAWEAKLLEGGRIALTSDTDLETLEHTLKDLVQIDDVGVDWVLQAVAHVDEQESEKLARVQIGRRPWKEEDRQQIYDLGYRYVVLQKDALLLPFDDSQSAHRVNRTRLRKFGQRLSGVAGNQVYDDSRVSIYSPWGAPSPCAEVEIERDTEQGSPPTLNATASVSTLETHSLRPIMAE